MKKTVFIIAAFGCLWTANAQKKEKEKKYKEVVYKDILKESDDVTISTNNGVSNKEMTKFKLKIANKTNDVILFKPEESVLKVAGKEVKPTEKWLEIYPADADFRVVNFKGQDYLGPYSYMVGGIYKVSTHGKTLEAPNFDLPASKNEFTAGGFQCSMKALYKETDKTEVTFDCKYTGDKIGVIQQNRAAVKLPDGTEMANEKKTKSKPVLVMKGKSQTVKLGWDRMEGGRATDMQKIKMIILWRDTFTEADAEKVNAETIDFEVDEALSK